MKKINSYDKKVPENFTKILTPHKRQKRMPKTFTYSKNVHTK